jgi:hypothetical protein
MSSSSLFLDSGASAARNLACKAPSFGPAPAHLTCARSSGCRSQTSVSMPYSRPIRSSAPVAMGEASATWLSWNLRHTCGQHAASWIRSPYCQSNPTKPSACRNPMNDCRCARDLRNLLIATGPLSGASGWRCITRPLCAVAARYPHQPAGPLTLN